MTVEMFATSLDTTIKLLLLWVLIYWAYRPYRVDSLRQRLFALRDDLFDIAANGEVDFNDPAYWRLRLVINGMIRFSHRVSFARLLFTSFLFSPSEGEGVSSYGRWRESLKGIESNATRDKLRSIHHQMNLVIVRHMITGSVVLMGAFVGMSIALLIKGVSRALADGVAEQLVKHLPSLSRLEDEAVEAHNYRLAA